MQAIPTTLLESTPVQRTTRVGAAGAENQGKAAETQADGGTLFLDRVNSMDLSRKAKILQGD